MIGGEQAHRYEERITIWQASTIDEAIRMAEAEAEQYAGITGEPVDVYLGLAQAYDLADPPGHGTEVFSLMRDSQLDPGQYLDQFFDTGFEKHIR